ncbi:hypothetical protein WJX81_005754 [Elliptochloris bilobata]|uniref:Acyltransferase n=1 Tax=Elliptochloris bilobata TaxID=381761 RepID=A0AAW1RYP7_9CHLO
MAGSARVEILSWAMDCLRLDALTRPASVAIKAPASEALMSTRGSVAISYGSDKVTVQPRSNNTAEEVVAAASMFLLFGWVFFGPWLTLASLYLALCGYRIALLFFTAVVGAALLPAQGEWPAFRNWPLFDTWRRYHRMHLIVPPLPYLKEGRSHLFAHFPHATFPMGAWLSMPLCGAPETGLPARTKGAVASILFRLPVVSQFFTWMGCLPAGRHTMLAALARGESLGVMPEGIAGIFTATRHRERIYARHKGYARLAIQAGTDVVPVYHLGQTQVLSYAPLSPTLSRKIKTACGFFYGRFFLPLPHPAQIVSVVGAPIAVVQRDEPTQAEVDALHAQVLAGLQSIFEAHKHLVPALAGKTLETLM